LRTLAAFGPKSKNEGRKYSDRRIITMDTPSTSSRGSAARMPVLRSKRAREHDAVGDELLNKLARMDVENSDDEEEYQPVYEDEVESTHTQSASEASLGSEPETETASESGSYIDDQHDTESEDQVEYRVEDEIAESVTDDGETDVISETAWTDDTDDDDTHEAGSSQWLQDVLKFQVSTHLLLPKDGFKLLVREIVQDLSKDMDVTEEAFEAMQAAAESHIVETFEAANMMAIHRGSDQIQPRDMQLVRRCRDL
jgi:histone H3/H4